MSFKIRNDESMRHAIRRLARKQLRAAVLALSNEDQKLGERIHDVRTSIKKVRALTRLVAPAHPRRARRADRRLHEIAAAMAAPRDNEVLLKTFDALLPNLAAEPASTSLRRARNRLARRLHESQRPFGNGRPLMRARTRLSRARRNVRTWSPPKGEWGWRMARRGLLDAYRKARRTMKRAGVEKTGAAFHRWRKAVKTHRYQIQLLEEVWPGEATAHVEALDRLGDILGEEHDLTVFEQTIERHPDCVPREEDRTHLLALVDRRRYVLRAEAMPLGQRLFAERPGAFRRRLRDELAAGARHSSAAAGGGSKQSPEGPFTLQVL